MAQGVSVAAQKATTKAPPFASKKPRTLTPTRPNAGVEAAYRKRLDAMVDEMQASLAYWLKAQYRARPPETMASDASPAVELQAAFRKRARRWQARFDELAAKLARGFVGQAVKHADMSFKQALRKGGMSVEFRMSAGVNDVVQASVAENVSLIKSIGSEHLADVEQLVMRSVATGRDLGQLSDDLIARHGVTKRRAAFISRDQNNKATATVTRARQQELGITQAKWLHSAGGHKPRPSHVKAGKDGLIYDVAKGALLDGVWTWPGHEINCRCVSIPVIEGF